jgi:ubiquinone/menaquinone biosynthesis C-methylase UbiE
MTDPTQRFSTRVENYVRYRPGYPESLIELLKNECGLHEKSVVADVGSGTGILSELFLKNGNPVFGIEPNREMRAAAEDLFKSCAQFHSLAGTAESTTLPSSSVDFITAGQAFHWFDRKQSRDEFRRILKPMGWVVLAWNDRRIDATAFLKDYERLLLKYGTDYQVVNHKNITPAIIVSFFQPAEVRRKVFENNQRLNFEALKGRLLSSSYVPEAGHHRYEEMLQELWSIFERHQVNELVEFEYDALVYYGQLTCPD